MSNEKRLRWTGVLTDELRDALERCVFNFDATLDKPDPPEDLVRQAQRQDRTGEVSRELLKRYDDWQPDLYVHDSNGRRVFVPMGAWLVFADRHVTVEAG